MADVYATKINNEISSYGKADPFFILVTIVFITIVSQPIKLGVVRCFILTDYCFDYVNIVSNSDIAGAMVAAQNTRCHMVQKRRRFSPSFCLCNILIYHCMSTFRVITPNVASR